MALFSKKQSPSQSPRRRTEPSETRPKDVEPSSRYAFRRNRTLTGSSSSKVASSAENNGQLRSSRVHAHHLAGQRRRIGGILGVVIFVSLMLVGLISQFTASVSVTMKNLPMTTVDPSYEKIIQQYYGERPTERLRFLLDEKTFTSYIQSKAPEVLTARTDGSAGFAKSIISLQLRKPVTGWNIHGVQQYVDTSGTAFTRNYYESPGVQIVDNSGVPVEAGRAVASNRFLGFVGRLAGFVTERGYTVEQLVIPSGTTRQVELKLKDSPYLIKCSIDRPAGEQAEDIDKTVTFLRQKGITPSYVDVRVSGKAFYQ